MCEIGLTQLNSELPINHFHGTIVSCDKKKEHRILAVGPSNWQQAFFVRTKSDANVIAFRKWLNKYSSGQFKWGNNLGNSLPPTTLKEQVMDRYWTHVVNCQSCRVAYKALNVPELALQVISTVSLGFVAAMKDCQPMPARIASVTMAILCFASSRWWSHFIYKNFHFHDYSHALIH